jgi:predicted nucleic acid-binding protein
VIYLDTSVALAKLLAESKRPPLKFWDDGRLLEYEIRNRINARQLEARLRTEVGTLLERVDFVELEPGVLQRALKPFPAPTRTLDGLHLATMDYLRSIGQAVELATYDQRLLKAATALGIAICPAQLL